MGRIDNAIDSSGALCQTPLIAWPPHVCSRSESRDRHTFQTLCSGIQTMSFFNFPQSVFLSSFILCLANSIFDCLSRLKAIVSHDFQKKALSRF